MRSLAVILVLVLAACSDIVRPPAEAAVPPPAQTAAPAYAAAPGAQVVPP